MNKYTLIGIFGAILLISLPIIAQSLNEPIGQYPFDNANITAIKAKEISYRDFDNAEGNTLYERLVVNYFINVTIPDDPYYQHYNYQTWVFYDSDSNNLQNSNKTVRNAIKAYALNEWNFTMNNNQVQFYAYVRGDQI